MSSREVTSTGVNARVVILPSAVIAKVAATNGRGGFRFRAGLLVLGDFMLERRDFLAHRAQLHVAFLAARFVEELNDSTWRARDEHDEEAHRPDENGDRLRNAAKSVQHDLENLLAQTNSGEADGQRRDGAFDRHDGKKIKHRDA